MADLMPQACDRCWRRKQKCDRQRSQCSKCREVAATCVERRMGLSLDPSRRDEHHSVEALEQRVENLRSLGEQRSSSSNNAGVNDPIAPAVQTSNDQSQSCDVNRSGEAIDGMRYLPLSALTEVRDRGTSENKMGFSTLLAAAIAASKAFTAEVQIGASDMEPTAAMSVAPRFSRAFMEGAVQTYSALCDIYCPFISKTALDQKLELVTSDTTQSLASEDKVMVNIAMVTGAFFLRGCRYREPSMSALVTEVRQSLLRAVNGFEGVEEVQHILATAVLSNYCPSVGSMWHLAGLAISRCFSYGLHTSESHKSDQEETSAQVHSRVFASAYILDTTIGSTLDRPFSIRDQNLAALSFDPGLQDAEYVGLSLVAFEQAQLLRATRDQADSSVMFHLANFEYWRETALSSLEVASGVKDLLSLQIRRMSCQVLVAIVHTIHRSRRSNEIHHLLATLQTEFDAYLKLLQQRSHSQDYAISWLDAVDLFALGVVVCYLSSSAGLFSLPSMAVARNTRICIELLTVSAERLPGSRTLAEILSILADFTMTGEPSFALALQTGLRQATVMGTCLPDRDRQLMQTIMAIPSTSPPFVFTGT